MGNNDWLRAYEDLLRRYLPALKRLVRSYTSEPVEQEDLLQDMDEMRLYVH